MCDCVTKVNKKLEEHNTRLDIPIGFDPLSGLSAMPNMKIATSKIDEKKKEDISFFATYCPVCGEKYEND